MSQKLYLLPNATSPAPTDLLYTSKPDGSSQGKITIAAAFSVGASSLIESGTFTLNAAGTVATGGTLVGLVLTITTVKKPKLIFLNCESVTIPTFSDGRTDGTAKVSNNHDETGLFQSNTSFSIYLVKSDSTGTLGNVTAITNNSFSITFTLLPVNNDIVGQWMAIMG